MAEYDERFNAGRHDEAIDTLKDEMRAVRADVSEMKAMMQSAKGSIRTLLAVGSIAGAIGAAIVKALALIKGGQS